MPRTAILFEPDSSGRPPKASLKILTEGHQYFRQVFKKPKPGDWLTVQPRGFSTITDRSDVLMGKVVAIHGVRSTLNPLPDIALKILMHRRLKLRADPSLASNLRDYFQLRQSCWLVEETDEGEFNCDCPVGFKGKNCKHGLGLSYKKGRIPVLPHAEALKLGEKRKRGRPKAINMQRPFSASAVVTEEADEAAVEVATFENVVLDVPGLEELALNAPTLEELGLGELAVEESARENPVEPDSEEVLVPAVIEPEKPKRGRPKKNKVIASEGVLDPALEELGLGGLAVEESTRERPVDPSSEEVLEPAYEEVNKPEKPKRGRPKKNKDIALKKAVRGVVAEARSMLEEFRSTGERALEPTLEEVVEPALEEVESVVTEVVTTATVGKTVERRKVVSPALKSGVRKRSKKVAKSRSPKSKAGGKRMRESVPPSTNTSPVLKPPQKSKRVTGRGAGIVERLIA